MIKNWTRTELFGLIIILDWSDRRSSPLIVCNKHIFISGNPAVEAGSLTTQINFAKNTAAVNIFDRRVVVQANYRLVVRKLSLKEPDMEDPGL